MIQVITATERHFSDFGWLKTYWLFSFADYYDPGNIQFGALRVFNDDVVEPGAGFPTHPHEEMEIITLVQSGEITHEDSMGNRAVMRAGEVQRMSAGTGLTHSEFNLGREPVHFFQVWILPDKGARARLRAAQFLRHPAQEPAAAHRVRAGDPRDGFLPHRRHDLSRQPQRGPCSDARMRRDAANLRVCHQG